ncbi:MAG TPA: thioredoxin-disulfide reductase [Methanosarcinales archaeon]|nr:MAG: thioredoxin-disulfide reductase [Methanosarcinales archaeon]HDN64777.1 thioredoxin-disulfide reductase [Methanosarcinales archaeon]
MEIYDVVIVGAGPAGITAGIYAKRARLSTIVIEKLGVGGQIVLSDSVENYPGFPEISGYELMQKFEEQARSFDLEVEDGEVITIQDEGEYKLVKADGRDYKTRSVIIASGAKPSRLGVKGEEDFIGRGVSFCATCDGFFFRDKDIIVVGGGDSAITEALFLSKIVNKVYVAHRRSELRATKILQERAFSNPKIEFVWNSVVEEIIGKDTVEGVVLRDVVTEERARLAVSGVFMYVGLVPNTEFIDAGKDDAGFILTDEQLATSIPGVFAAGDCRATQLRQVATAVGDGALAAMSAERYLG